MSVDLSRRNLLALGLSAAATAALAGCSTTGPAESASDPSWRTTRVRHAFGTTVLERRPARVVTVGVTEQDFVLALGIKPVGVTDWYGDQPSAMWPWAREANGTNTPTVLTTDDGFQFAKIAALRPDLIIGTNSGMTKKDYATLTKIAPTLAQASADEGYFAPWTDMLDSIGAIVGREDRAAAVTSEVEGRFVSAAAANPGFAGIRTIFLQNAVYDGNLIASQQGLGTEFLTDLGLTIPREIDRFAKDGEQAYIPVEQIRTLDAADLLVWGTEKDSDRTALEAVPGFRDLAAVRAGRSVYTGGRLSGAIYFSSPLSLPYVVDALVPEIAAALAR